MSASNSAVIADREIVSGAIEGVYFGPRLWVIARSPTAVLAWVYGHSASINGHQSYYQPHLLILPDRTPTFMYRPHYKSLQHEWTRLNSALLHLFSKEICEVFGADALQSVLDACAAKRTAIIEGGGGALKPIVCWGHAYDDWRAAGGGFIVRPEGVTEHDTMRYKLGWKPKNV